MGNTQKHHTTMRATAVAVKGVIAALAIISSTYAIGGVEGDEAHNLTHPTNTIQIGVGNVGDYTAKYFEYSPIDDDGVFAIGALDLSGGGSYDSDNPFRWNVKADAQNGLAVDVGAQGTYRIEYRYDEIHRNYSDDYKTPYRGVGTDNLTLPGYPAVRTSSTSNAGNAMANWGNLQAPYANNTAVTGCYATNNPNPPSTAACRGPGYLIPAMMHQEDIGTERDKHIIDISGILSPEWKLTAYGQHEEKEGTKLTGVAFGGFRGALLPEKIDFTTDQFKTALAYSGEQGSFTVGYDGSFFKNDNDIWRAANPFQANAMDPAMLDSAQLFGAPDNQMHRFNLGGSWNFTPTTRLVANGHYQKNTQDQDWDSAVRGLTWDWPHDSADAEVVDKNFNTTLTSRPIKDLALTAVYKYEDRDNHTDVQDYLTPLNPDGGSNSLVENEPVNKKTHKASLDANYTFAPRQAIKVGYDYETIERTTDDHPENLWAIEDSTENTYRVDYRNNLLDTVTGRIGYSYAQRRASYPYETWAVLSPTNVVLGGDGMVPGFEQFFLADRDRDQLRSAIDFQVTDAFSLTTGVDFNHDTYINSDHGLQDSDSWVFKLDGNYDANENLKLNSFYTLESRESTLDGRQIQPKPADGTVLAAPLAGCTDYYTGAGFPLPADAGTSPCRQWSETAESTIHSIGVGFELSGLPSKKYTFLGELTYSHAVDETNMDGGAYFSNGSPAALAPAPNNVWIAAEDFPDVTSSYFELHLAGIYDINPVSSVRIDYYYAMLNSDDWQYDAYANDPTAIQTYVGTGMESANYSTHVIGASYIYKFDL